MKKTVWNPDITMTQRREEQAFYEAYPVHPWFCSPIAIWREACAWQRRDMGRMMGETVDAQVRAVEQLEAVKDIRNVLERMVTEGYVAKAKRDESDAEESETTP